MKEFPVPRKEIQKEFGEVKPSGQNLFVLKYGTKEVVGQATVFERSQPFPHYALLNLDVLEAEERGKGFSSQLMQEIESMSVRSGFPVLLYDTTGHKDRGQNPEAIGMYAKRLGWAPLRRADGTPTDRYVYGTNDPDQLASLYETYK